MSAVLGRAGPRGGDPRPVDVHDLDNLMLLCPGCHKTIDDNPTDFTRDTLKAYKRDHEERVRHLTGFGPDLKPPLYSSRRRLPDVRSISRSTRYPTRNDAMRNDAKM